MMSGYDARPLRRGWAGSAPSFAVVSGDALSADHATTPSARGYRMPAEWAPHEATWLSWPHNRDSWPGVFERVEPAMVEFVRALAECEPVYINVLDAGHERHVRKLLADGRAAGAAAVVPLPDQRRLGARPRRDLRDATRPRSRASPSTSTTTRGAASIRRSTSTGRSAGRWPRRSACRATRKPGIVLEGGSIEVNGEGALLTTEQCLLNPNRNPALTRADIEALLRDCFGVREILWLGEGIEGDDTDGHIDDLTRFVAPGDGRDRRRAEPRRPEPRAAGREPALARHALRRRPAARRSSSCRCRSRSTSRTSACRRATRTSTSRTAPCSCRYSVARPTTRRAESSATVSRAGASLPIDCRVLIAGLGALHCLTQQVPAAPRAGVVSTTPRAPGLWPAARFPNLHAFDGRLDA